MARGRLFICDPACVQQIGHNVHALRYFKSAFSAGFSEVIAVCCNSLPDDIALEEGFVKHYQFYYPEFFPGVPATGVSFSESHDSMILDGKERLATLDAEKLLQMFSMNSHDNVFFPHLDFYGVVGLLNALQLRSESERPRLYLRFIGVMENATDHYKFPCNELLFRLRVAAKRGIQISASAETPRYADLVAQVLEARVAVTGYPLTEQKIPLPEDGPFYFYCPGSARADKGYFELLDIFREVRNRDPDCNIRFITQSLPSHDLVNHLSYTAQLYAIPGVEMQVGTVSAEEMISTYCRSHAVLLPYARDVYEYRGSAVLMEAASYGRPAIAYSGMAFSDVVSYYGLGKVVSSQSEMIDSIMQLSGKDRGSLEIVSSQASYRFHADNLASYRSWLEI